MPLLFLSYYGWNMVKTLDDSSPQPQPQPQDAAASKQRFMKDTAMVRYRFFFVMCILSLTIFNLRSIKDSKIFLEMIKDNSSVARLDENSNVKNKSRGLRGNANNNSQKKKRPSIVLFGDSITQRAFGEDGGIGWASLLASAYTRRADVINRGFGGYNTHHALHVLPNILDAYDDNLLFATVFFGANDAALPGARQHLSVEEYGDNLKEIIETIRARMKLSNPDKQVPILLFTPPPVDEVTWTKFSRKPEANRKNLVTRDYGIRVHDVARYMNCSVVDTWELLEGSNATVYSQYLTDGLHLNERGNRVLYQGLMDLIQTEYPPLAPQRGGQLHGIPFEEPAWQEYD